MTSRLYFHAFHAILRLLFLGPARDKNLPLNNSPFGPLRSGKVSPVSTASSNVNECTFSAIKNEDETSRFKNEKFIDNEGIHAINKI